MKAVKLIILLLSFHFSLCAQDFKVTDLKTPFLLDDVIYSGIENPVNIVGEDIDFEKLKIITPDTGIEILPSKEDELYYILTHLKNYDDPKQPVIKLLVVSTQNSNEVIYSKNFRIRRIPKAEVYFGAYKNKDSIDLDNFERPLAINVKTDSFDFLEWKVFKYRLIYVPANSKEIMSIFVENDSINTQISKILNNLNEGDIIIMEDVWASYYNECGASLFKPRRLPATAMMEFY